MNRLLSLCSHFFLLVLISFSRHHTRERRQENFYIFVSRLSGFRYRVIDWLSPGRRKLLLERKYLIDQLAALGESAVVNESQTNSLRPVSYETDFSGLKMAIFIPSFFRGQGGAEKVAGQVATVLNNAGIKVEIFCRDPLPHSTPHYHVSKDVKINRLDERDDLSIASYRAHNFDLLIGFGMAHFFQRIAHIASLLQCPYVIQECTHPLAMERNLLRLTDSHTHEDAYWLRQAVFAKAAAIRFTTSAYSETVQKSQKKICYSFYNAFQVPANHVVPSYIGHGDKRFICVGALKNLNKNGLVAVESFADSSKYMNGWSLELFGTNNYRNALKHLLSKKNCSSVFDNGAEQNLSNVYSTAYALLIPSFEEGLPNVVVEAFSYGVPCIGFRDCPGVNELIIDGKNGFLVDRVEPDGFKKAIQQIAVSSVRNELSKGAFAFAEENFSFNEWTTKWLDIVWNASKGLDRFGREIYSGPENSDRVESDLWDRLLSTYRLSC